jgi:hypothetical protein
MKSSALSSLTEKKFALWGTLIYAVVVTVLSCFHEVWRDEVIPLSLVIDSHSLADVFAKSINYGHGALWYYVLYFGYALCHKAVVLKVLNVLICVVAVYVFLSRAPFSRLQKALFIGGVLPLYVYPVINRDYGLTMLLVFLFCVLYDKRFTNFISLSVILFLLANLVAYSTIMVMAISGALLLEFIFFADSRRQWMARPWDTAVGLALIVLGIAACIITLTPDYTMSIVRPPITAPGAVMAAIKAIMMPEKAYPTLFGIESDVFLKLATWAYLIYLGRRGIRIFWIVGGCWLALAMLFHLVWPTTALRHQGAFLLVFVTAMWLDGLARGENRPYAFRPLEAVRAFVARHKNSAFTLILILQVCAAYPEIKRDVRGDYSASRKLAEFIRHDPALKDAVVVPEPDTFGEAYSYYGTNPVFFPREDQFRRYARFTIESRGWYSLAELLASAKNLRAQRGQPVVIVLGHRLSPQGPFLIQFSAMTHKAFTYTPESLRDFNSQTVKAASFRPAITDEEFDVYLLK